MKTVFCIVEAMDEGNFTRVRGRAEALISTGDELVYESQKGVRILISVVRIETYGRTTAALDSMWTGDLILSVSGGRPEGAGKLLRDE
jgi:hypothetical protein